MGNVGRGLNEPQDTDSPSAKYQCYSRRADERVQARVTSCSQDEKNYFLEAGELQVGQWYEDVERKQEYYHIIIFSEMT